MPLHKKIKKQKEENLRKPLLASTATPGTNLLKGRAARFSKANKINLMKCYRQEVQQTRHQHSGLVEVDLNL